MKLLLLFLYPLSSLAGLSTSDLELRWSSAYELEINKDLKQDESIREPIGAVVVVAELSLFSKNFLSFKDCLVYRVPSPESAGALTVISVKVAESCYKNRFKKSIFKQKSIFNFSFLEKKQSLRLAIDKEVLKFYFFNIIDKKKSIQADYNYKISGVRVSFIDSFGDERALDPFTICRDIPKKCGEKTRDLCHLCPGGESYSVIASNCESSLRKYCGRKICGNKNNPACMRGRAATKYSGGYCLTDSPVGICTKPSRVVCLNEELYCR